MRGKLIIKHADDIIEMSREFAKYAAYVGSEEYNLLQQTRRDYPTYTVVRKQIKKNKNTEHHKGLTYGYMENYIQRHDDEKKTIMKEYKEMRLISDCHSVRYPVIKKWFLEKFPDVAKFGVDKTETENTEVSAQEADNALVKSADITEFPAQNVEMEVIEDAAA